MVPSSRNVNGGASPQFNEISTISHRFAPRTATGKEIVKKPVLMRNRWLRLFFES